MSTNGWMDKQYMTQPYNGMLLDNKIKGNIDSCYNMDKP